MRIAIEWTETKPGELEGRIADNGPSMEQLKEEMLNMPIDLPSLKNPDATKCVTIFYPETNFSKERKELFERMVHEMYDEGWNYEGDESQSFLTMIPPEAPTEQE
jgi:hypothetical protein